MNLFNSLQILLHTHRPCISSDRARAQPPKHRGTVSTMSYPFRKIKWIFIVCWKSKVTLFAVIIWQKSAFKMDVRSCTVFSSSFRFETKLYYYFLLNVLKDSQSGLLFFVCLLLLSNATTEPLHERFVFVFVSFFC